MKEMALGLVLPLLLIPSGGEPAGSGRSLDQAASRSAAGRRAILDAKDWPNPFIVVHPDGYELILHREPRSTARHTVKQLEHALRNLPPSRWPLGKVVTVSEAGVRPPDATPAIRRHGKTLQVMLRRLGIEVDPWPSA